MTARPTADGSVFAPAPAGLHGEAVESVSASEFRAALPGFTTAISIIATNGPAGVAGMTCSAISVVSDTPATMVACVSRRSAANTVIKTNGVFCINCLPATRMELSQLFAGVGQVPMAERFTAGHWSVLATGAPVLKDALAAFDCELMDGHEVGTHTVLVARVVATAHTATAEPLVYHRQQYATTRAL
jgi:flavin reductase (NADH)/flavin reductase/chlorophenol-4-monooxygenase component 1